MDKYLKQNLDAFEDFLTLLSQLLAFIFGFPPTKSFLLTEIKY